MSFGYNDYLLFFSFSLLVGLGLFKQNLRKFYQEKSLFDWFIDISNLLLQGVFVPVLQVSVIYVGLKLVWPQGESVLKGGFILGFLINFLLVDYIYYFNHKVLHLKKLFPIHLVHHTVNEFDVFATSKNTIWTSFFIIYLPAGAIFLFLLENDSGYIWGACISAILDLWKHSRLQPNGTISKVLSSYLFIMTPAEHSHHHGVGLHFNYGANLNLWDKIHHTYIFKDKLEERMGVKTRLSPFEKFLNPFAKGKK